jgi:hypothetical protein
MASGCARRTPSELLSVVGCLLFGPPARKQQTTNNQEQEWLLVACCLARPAASNKQQTTNNKKGAREGAFRITSFRDPLTART